MKKLLPVLLALIGTGAGVGAGIFLAPARDTAHGTAAEHGEVAPDAHGETPAATDEHAEAPAAHAAPAPADHGGGEHAEGGPEFVKLNNQFIVPVLDHDRVKALVVLSLSLEVTPGFTETVYSYEPKLRDVFLKVMFDHANIGGFEGNFTEAHRMQILRRALFEAARNTLGTGVTNVLITEIARQDN